MKAYLEYQPWNDNYNLYITFRGFGDKKYYFNSLEVQEKLNDGKPLPPLIENPEGFDTKEFIQAIVDAAWDKGIRPTGFSDIKNETTAIKYHLEDMRKLVFKGK